MQNILQILYGYLITVSLHSNEIFEWSINQLSSQTGQLTGQPSVKSKLPSPRPTQRYQNCPILVGPFHKKSNVASARFFSAARPAPDS